MILLLILVAILALLTMFIIGITASAGAIGIVMFGDVIVCMLVIIWIIKKLIRRD